MYIYGQAQFFVFFTVISYRGKNRNHCIDDLNTPVVNSLEQSCLPSLPLAPPSRSLTLSHPRSRPLYSLSNTLPHWCVHVALVSPCECARVVWVIWGFERAECSSSLHSGIDLVEVLRHRDDVGIFKRHQMVLDIMQLSFVTVKRDTGRCLRQEIAALNSAATPLPGPLQYNDK